MSSQLASGFKKLPMTIHQLDPNTNNQYSRFFFFVFGFRMHVNCTSRLVILIENERTTNETVYHK